MKVEMKSVVEVTPQLVARIFCDMDDENQTLVLDEIGRIAEEAEHNFEAQWFYLGGHLRECKCSTGAGRRFIETLHDALKTSTHT